VPGVVEQSDYKIVLTHHQLRLAELHAKLYEATADAAHKRSAIETANSVTWCLMSDGKMRQGFWAHAAACPLVLSFNEQFSRIMACIPETAPRFEDHLLRSRGDVKSIRYQLHAIEYETVAAGEEIFIVRNRPRDVTAAGEKLARLDALGNEAQGWTHADTGLLRVRHRAPKVEIHFPVEAQSAGERKRGDD
jgi:hypothetical protein